MNFKLHKHGIEIIKSLISNDSINAIIKEVELMHLDIPAHGVRNAEKKFSKIASVVSSLELIKEARKYLIGDPRVVRVIFFDKTPKKNWLVTWHQDKTVAVNKRFESNDWGPWSIKEGIHHVQPPLDVLNEMVTFRLHLDAANSDNGCLRVIPESHYQGVLKQEEIISMVSETEPYLCEVDAGDALVMRPHIIHSSSKASNPLHRRTLHIEYSGYKLPRGVNWA